MGTNFYLEYDPCATCGHAVERLHIGKSSAGWCFALHVTDEIKSLDDWKAQWAKGGTIHNEYNEAVSVDEMLRTIMDRGPGREWGERSYPMMGYLNEDDFHRRNESERGPNNLLRHKIDGRHCVGHGDGTWDYIRGDFS